MTHTHTHTEPWSGWVFAPNLVALPPVGDVGPDLLLTHQLPHLLYGRVGRNQVIVGQLVLLVDA